MLLSFLVDHFHSNLFYFIFYSLTLSLVAFTVLILYFRWREFPLNGVNTVHDKFRRRSSSVSMSVPATPITPVTPAGESKVPTAPPPHIPLTWQTSSERVVTPSPASAPSEVVESFPTPVTPQSCEETTLSARSSATSLSLGTLEVSHVMVVL